MQRIEAMVSAIFKIALLIAITVLSGCGDVKPVTKAALPIGRYQIVSGQFRYWDGASRSLTGTALLKIDTVTGITYQFVAPYPESVGGEWHEVK